MSGQSQVKKFLYRMHCLENPLIILQKNFVTKTSCTIRIRSKPGKFVLASNFKLSLGPFWWTDKSKRYSIINLHGLAQVEFGT